MRHSTYLPAVILITFNYRPMFCADVILDQSWAETLSKEAEIQLNSHKPLYEIQPAHAMTKNRKYILGSIFPSGISRGTNFGQVWTLRTRKLINTCDGPTRDKKLNKFLVLVH
jgi:hypothetical protein